MINLQFLPSRHVALYTARLFAARSLAMLAALVVVLMTLDLLGNSGEILAQPSNGDAELWRYVGLRLPQLVNRFLPFSVLLGTLITLAALNQHSEIVSMKAAGISAHQIIAPLILAAALFALAHFAFNERIVTRATAALDAWEAAEWGPVPQESGIQTNIALASGDNLIFVTRVTGRDEAVRLGGITVYERVGGTLRRIITAAEGRRAGGEWELSGVTVFEVDSGRLNRFGRMRFGREITPIR